MTPGGGAKGSWRTFTYASLLALSPASSFIRSYATSNELCRLSMTVMVQPASSSDRQVWLPGVVNAATDNLKCQLRFRVCLPASPA